MQTPRYLRARHSLPVESPDILHNGHRYRHVPFLPERRPAATGRIKTDWQLGNIQAAAPMPLTSPGNDDDTGENHQPTLRKNTAEPVEQTLKQNNMEQSHAHRAARPEPVPHPRQSTSRLPTVDVSPFGRSRHPPGAPCPASVRQPAPNKQRHNRHIREIKPDMKTSTQTDEKARHRNQKQRRQNQEPTQPVTRYDAIRKPKKKHIPMQSPKEMDFLHPPPRGGRLSAERQRF